MPFKYQRICPICGKQEVSNISNHLFYVHDLDSANRKSWLKVTKHQTMNTVYKHLSTQTRDQLKHSSTLKRSHVTMKHKKKQKIATRPRIVNQFLYSKMLYPNFKFQHPMSILVVGPTNSGKTYFVEQLLSNLDEKMNFKNSNLKCRISWFYGQWQQCYAVMQRKLGKCIRFVQGLPEYNDDLGDIDIRFNHILVLDDLMLQAKDSAIVSKLFTQGRHRNASVILMLQNAFPKGKFNTDISRNAQYMILFKSPADRKQIEIISQRIFPKEQNKFMSIYNKETDRQHGYILVDNTPSTNRDSQIVTDIFTITQKIPISSSVNKIEGSDSSTLAIDAVTSLNLSPPNTITEEENEEKVSNLPKKLISTVWILDSYEIMDRKVTRAPFLRQLPVKHHLKCVFKAAANKTIKYFSIYNKNGTSAWPVLLLNYTYEEEYAFVGIECKELDSFLRSHAHEVSEWC